MRIANRPLSILFIATSSGEGGIERHSARLAARLRERGTAVHYACRPDGFLAEHCRAAGIPVVEWSVRNSGDLRAARELAAFARRAQIDMIHVHSRRDYVPAALAAAFAGRSLRRRPRVLLHAHLVRPLGDPPRLSGRFFGRLTDGVIAVSAAVRDTLNAAHGFRPGFVHLIPNGIDTDAFPEPDSEAAQTQRRAWRARWGVPDSAMLLGMVGRLNAKGQDALLSALPRLIGAFLTLSLVLIGPDGDFGDTERLRTQAASLGLQDRVHLAGMLDDVPGALSAFDALVHLPADESFGLVLAEAMAAGLPTVATDIGGCGEVVRNGETGLLVPLGDQGALTNALTDLLSSPDRRAALGAEGRRVALSEFSLDRQVDRLQELYHELCPPPPHGRRSRS